MVKENWMLVAASVALLPFEFETSAQAQAQPLAPDRKTELGQYMTPQPIARFMASKFDDAALDEVHLLDAGAGRGALSSAFAARWAGRGSPTGRLKIDAYEIDPSLLPDLKKELSGLRDRFDVEASVVNGDFIEQAVGMIVRQKLRPYSHAILNPPYKKITNDSRHRLALREAGIETVNLYTAFVALSLLLLKPGGELVAILPRSFCNGPYYRSFRRFVLERASLESIHLFTSRDHAFKEDGVLQENVIIHLKRDGHQNDVTISTSQDAEFTDLHTLSVPFDRIVFPQDKEQFIHVPTDSNDDRLVEELRFQTSLASVGIDVSTGPVVDFRFRDNLLHSPEPGSAPLLYPVHLKDHEVHWPQLAQKKPNAIRVSDATRRMLYPNGFYVAVRRFSSKEESHRVVASLIDPSRLPSGPIGFENHLNIFHERRKPLPENLARGLVTFLNSDIVDRRFRRFNGHTQVNATDLRSLGYPDRAELIDLGALWVAGDPFSQEEIDYRVAGSP